MENAEIQELSIGVFQTVKCVQLYTGDQAMSSKTEDSTPLIYKFPDTEEDNNMGKKEETTLFMKYMHVVGVVALYWSVSISMVFLNKYLLKSDDLQLNAPLFVTWYQCVVTVALCVACDIMAKRNPGLMSFPSTTFDMKLSREALPLSFVFVAMITFNNLCLREVGVAFYTVSRSLVTIFSLIFTYFILGKKTTMRAIACCGIVIAGFFLGVKQESLGEMSNIGVVYGVVASAMVALNAIYIKKVLPAMDNSIWKLTYYNNVNAVAMFLPMIFLSEMSEIIYFDKISHLSFWGYMTTSGFMGFIMGYVVGLEVKVTTPVTHTVSGVAKACCQTVIAVLWYHEVKTGLWWFANILVLFGTGAYSIVKSLDMRSSHESGKVDEETADAKKPLV